MAIAVIISGFGALNGWTMICAEMPLAAADDGLFPQQFKRMSKKGVPAYGIIASTVLASIAMIINYLGSSGATVFTTLVLMTGITAAIPYGFSALVQLKWRWVDHRARADSPVCARHDRCRAIPGVLGLVHLVLPQHRPQLLGLLGSVLPGWRRAAAWHPGLRLPAPPPHRAGTCAAPTLTAAGQQAASRDEPQMHSEGSGGERAAAGKEIPASPAGSVHRGGGDGWRGIFALLGGTARSPGQHCGCRS